MVAALWAVGAAVLVCLVRCQVRGPELAPSMALMAVDSAGAAVRAFLAQKADELLK